MSRFISPFVIIFKKKKTDISNPTVFAGGAYPRRWGRAGPGRPRLTQPAPGPAGDIFRGGRRYFSRREITALVGGPGNMAV